MTTGKTTALTRWTLVGKVMSLLLNMLSRLVITFVPRSKRLLISWLQSPSAVILEPRKIKSVTVFHCFPIYFPWSVGPDALILVFWMLSFQSTFSYSSFTFIKRLFSSSLLSAIRWCHLHIWGYWYFSRQSWFQLVFLPVQRFSWCTLRQHLIRAVVPKICLFRIRIILSWLFLRNGRLWKSFYHILSCIKN